MSTSLDQSRQAFVAFLKSKGKAYATILAYGNDIAQFTQHLKNRALVNIEQITSEDIEAFKNDLLEKKYTSKSVARKLNSIKTYFRFLMANFKLSQNPSESVAHPKYSLNPPRILTKIEYRSLRDSCRSDPRMYAIVELFLQTGIRISELARLTMDDIIDGNKLHIVSYESHETRTIPLNKPAQAALDVWLAHRPRVANKSLFITKTGNQFQVRNIRTAMDRYFRIAGIMASTVNDLRHTFIAHQLKAGTPLILVSKLAGHKRLSTTEKYLEFIREKAGSSSEKLEEL